VIVLAYLSLSLVVGVSAALLFVVAGRAPAEARLFLRCMRWGVATGAVTGGLFGATVTLVGSIEGDPGSPSYPSSEWSVRRDLTAVFGVVVGGLDLILVVTITATADLSSLAAALPLILAANGCVVVMLSLARRSIGRLWSATGGAPAETGP